MQTTPTPSFLSNELKECILLNKINDLKMYVFSSVKNAFYLLNLKQESHYIKGSNLKRRVR